MGEQRPPRGPAAGPRARKATDAERRERRAAVQDPGEVLDAAARFLEARPRSETEVRRKLIALGYRAALVDDAVARLVALRYLDDEAFARAWVESRDRAHPRGEHALRRELSLKGVDRSLVDEVLAERRDAAQEAAAARDRDDGEGVPASPDDAAAERLLRRRLAAILREPDPRRRRQRAYATLARSGFAPDTCSSVVRRVLDDVSDDDPDDAEGGAGA